MRKTGLLSAALLLATSGIALNLHAQDAQSTAPSSPNTTTTQTTTTQTTNATTQSLQAFTGKISKKDNQYLLEDKDKSASYKLDDAKKADRFEGKNVRVMGTLDGATNMIHVQTIEEENNKS